MKILVFNIAKPKEVAAIFAYGVAKGLAENGVEVYALMQENVQNREQWDKLLGNKHVYYTKLNNDEESHSKQLIKFYTSEIRKIKNHFKGITFDYVLTTVFANWSTFFLPVFKTRNRIAVCHDPLPHSGEKKLNVFLAKRYYQHNDKLIVLTKRFREFAAERYNKKVEDVFVIPHGRMNSYTLSENPLKAQNYKKENINFVFFGRIEKYKGLGVLGEAYKILSSQVPNVTLTVAGNGDFSEFKELYDGLKNTKLIIRYIDDDEVGGLFNGANVVTVVPYIDATQSGIIPIAMEYGTPIIASNTGGLKEQLNDGKIGLLFEAGNAQALADVMKQITEQPQIFEEQKLLEKEYLKSLDWNVVMNQLLINL